MPDPSWTLIGAQGHDGYEYFDAYGSTYLAGWADINVQVYGIPDINNDSGRNDNYYACVVSLAEQNPAYDGANGTGTSWSYDGPYNKEAEIGIDWNMWDEWSSSDLQDYSPSSPESGNYDFSGSITLAAYPSATLGIGYDPEYIEREDPSRINDKVTWNWDFPHTLYPTDSEARWDTTDLAVGTSCKLMEPTSAPNPPPGLAEVWYDPVFEARRTINDTYYFQSDRPRMVENIQSENVS